MNKDPRVLEEERRIVAASQERGDFITDVDGFVYWRPLQTRGHLSAWHLRVLAEELDRRNKDWQDEIDAYMTRSGRAYSDPPTFISANRQMPIDYYNYRVYENGKEVLHVVEVDVEEGWVRTEVCDEKGIPIVKDGEIQYERREGSFVIKRIGGLAGCEEA